MRLSQFTYLLTLLTALGALASPVQAQLISGDDSLIDKFNAMFPVDHSHSMSVSELCHRLDSLAEQMRNDGLIVLKQPDVFSQARMTRFRADFETQMSSDLANFHLVLAARINRLDSATTTQTTSLGAALSAPGTTNVQNPAPTATQILGTTNNLFSGTPSLFGQQISPNQGTFGSLGLATNNFAPITSASAAAATALGLGVDPTVYLDEKKRFLEALNQIRRINLGPDQNDSSGYGLYLVRLPVSINPGECTYQGYGADLTLRVEHEFTPDFLPSTFKNLVINDLIDQLSPLIYELIRSGAFDKLKTKVDLQYRKEVLEHKNNLQLESKKDQFATKFSLSIIDRRILLRKIEPNPPATAPLALQLEPYRKIAQTLANYILRSELPLTGDPEKDRPVWVTVASRLEVLNASFQNCKTGDQGFDARISKLASELTTKIESVENGAMITDSIKADVLQKLQILLFDLLNADVDAKIQFFNYNPITTTFRSVSSSAPEPEKKYELKPVNLPKLWGFLKGIFATVLTDDVGILDELLALGPEDRKLTAQLASNNREIDRIKFDTSLNKIALPSIRSAKQFYPLAPRELISFFLDENIYTLASDAADASRTLWVRASDVRNYLRHTLDTAYYAMAYSTEQSPGTLPPLADTAFIQLVRNAIYERDFSEPNEDVGPPGLKTLYKILVTRLAESRQNIRQNAIGALCWAIAVDAAILDGAIHHDAHKVFLAKGIACDALEGTHFYFPNNVPNDVGKAIFCDYVKQRWPIVTFSLDPVTDQQNIADSFNLKRDLQLALSFAFATGQISFSQLSTFQRKIEQSSDTIALNRTVTSFSHENDIFGFRFTPRFQNPPNQRTNIGVIASQLWGGGPGPDYQTKKSKLEPGMRELTAVLLIPTFLPTMRMDITGNWFKLVDPEHLVFHTRRMMERGRRVQELRQCVGDIENSHEYREADIRVLHSKLAQLEAMLPMQSRVIQLPFENSANGFDLFSEGATALVPELTGYSGVDVITAPKGDAGVKETFSATTLTTPATTTNYSVGGGTTSIADVFVMGKYISLLDTRVIAGGRITSFEILSREVVHVQVPSNVIPTTTYDHKSYVEIYLATPNGVSNSIFVPYQPATPAPNPAYDVAAASQSIDVYYQWLPGPGGKSLIPTLDPGDQGAITLTWNSNTGLGPRQIQVQFAATVNGQNVIMSLPAQAGNKGDYKIDGAVFAVTLLNRLQGITVPPALPPTSIKFTLTVQPWLPADTEGLRVRTEGMQLNSKVTVNLQYNETGVNALPNVAPAIPPPPPAAPAAKKDEASSALFPNVPERTVLPDKVDSSLVRTAGQIPSLSSLAAAPPSVKSFLSNPQPPPPLSIPSLLGPNVSSEAEQVAKLLTGQPVASAVSPQLTNLPISLLGLAAPGAANLAASPATPPPPAGGQVPPIFVTPSPVVVVSPPPTKAKKQQHTSRLHQMFNRLGNRVNQAMSQ